MLIFATRICYKFCFVDDFSLPSMMRWGKRICNLVLLMIVSMEIVLLLKLKEILFEQLEYVKSSSENCICNIVAYHIK